MKKINLKTALSKYHNGHNIRVIATMRLISKPISGKPRTVLLTDIRIDGKNILDHIWIPYKGTWTNFTHKDRHKQFTFKAKVKSTIRGPMTKFILGSITDVQLLEDYVPKKQKIEKPQLIRPDTAKLIPLLPAKRRTSIQVTAMAININEQKILLKDITLIDHPTIKLEELEVPITPGQIHKIDFSLPEKIKCTIKIAEDLHKILPYQPVKTTALKNLTQLKEI